MNNTVQIFITVRSSSTRLPNKALLKINNTPMIILLVKRISKIKNSQVVVCTTTEKSDDYLAKLLETNNINVFRGDNEDILNRLYKASIKFKADKFVVVEGDDLFCDSKLVEDTWKMLSETNSEFISWESLPLGSSPTGIKTNKLKILIEKKKSQNTETGWIKFILDSGIFKNLILKHQDTKLHRTDIRLTVDYKEDYDLAMMLYDGLSENFSLIDIIHLIDKNPDLKIINERVKKHYVENFKKKMINEQLSGNT